MGDFTIGTKSVLSQSGSDEAVLSGDLVFPAGHIVQTTTATVQATKTNVDGTDNVYVGTVVQGTITPIFDDSSIVVVANFSTHVHSESSSDHGFALRWKKSGTGISADTFPNEMRHGNMNNGHANYYADPFQFGSTIDTYSISVMDNDFGVSDVVVNYELWVSPYGIDTNLYIGSNVWDNTNWMIYFQEIKR